jgi:hypothetical protein
MRSIATKIIAVCSFAFSIQAHAGLMLEPYLAFESGVLAEKSSLGIDVSKKLTGTVLGARLGYSLPLLPVWFGIDYSLTTGGKAKADTPLSSDQDYKRQSAYATVGVQLPILANFWLGYGVLNDLELTSTGVSNKLSGGSNMKLGVGFKLIPFLSINAELYQNKQNKQTFNGVSGDYGPGLVNQLDSGLRVGLSIPL